MTDRIESEGREVQQKGQVDRKDEQAEGCPGKSAEQLRSAPRHFPLNKWTLLLLLAVGSAIGGAGYWRFASVRESTDDAQIDGHLHPVSARVGGTVIKVLVQDNQYVEAGTILAEIDPSDYKVALDRARADLAEVEASLHVSQTEVPISSTTTFSQLSGAEASVGEADASVAAAQREVDSASARLNVAQAKVREARANDLRAARDLERMAALVAKEEVSRQQYDLAVATAESYRAQVDSALSQVREAEQGIRVAESQVAQQQARLVRAQTAVRSASTAPQQVAVTRARAESAAARVQQMRASLEQAQLNLAYTTVRAPASGIISQRTVEAGQVVPAGQTLLAVIPLDVDHIWVTANFKETQLKNVRPGQRVTISVDTYGDHEYAGHVESVAAATGARSSLLPPENATGNFVKVVQRVPVKIAFERGQDPEHRLRPGMSVFPTVLTK
jgi:membrane fusion protein (multidrug efflux system)